MVSFLSRLRQQLEWSILTGFNLTLEEITSDDIGVKGVIKSIELEKD